MRNPKRTISDLSTVELCQKRYEIAYFVGTKTRKLSRKLLDDIRRDLISEVRKSAFESTSGAKKLGKSLKI